MVHALLCDGFVHGCMHCNKPCFCVRSILPLLQVLRNGSILINPDDDANATSSAPDGDLDAAYALLLAGRKWHDASYTERGVKVTAAHLVKHL